MTVTARKVLRDCEIAYEFLGIEEDEKKFRLFWVSCVSLLRAVGHVLRKVDCANDEKLKAAVDTWWGSIKSDKSAHPIFHQFIDPERNNILKEYDVGILSGAIEVLIGEHEEPYTLTETEYCPMTYGIFEGEDCREIAFLAITWWKYQLDRIEQSIP